MTASPQIGRRLTYRRQERRLLHKMVRQAAQSIPDVQTSANAQLTPAEIVAQWKADDVIGSWASREDIQDSAEYARQLRWKAEHRDWE